MNKINVIYIRHVMYCAAVALDATDFPKMYWVRTRDNFVYCHVCVLSTEGRTIITVMPSILLIKSTDLHLSNIFFRF